MLSRDTKAKAMGKLLSELSRSMGKATVDKARKRKKKPEPVEEAIEESEEETEGEE